MANISVSYADIEAAASELRAGQADIEERLSSLHRRIQELVTGGYVTDRSSGAFSASYEEFTSGVSQTIQGLDGLAGFLTAASRALSETDEALASGLRR